MRLIIACKNINDALQVARHIPNSKMMVNHWDQTFEVWVGVHRMTTLVHLVKAWSGKAEDEMPLCKAKGSDVFGNRTIYRDTATCLVCLNLRDSNDHSPDTR